MDCAAAAHGKLDTCVELSGDDNEMKAKVSIVRTRLWPLRTDPFTFMSDAHHYSKVSVFLLLLILAPLSSCSRADRLKEAESLFNAAYDKCKAGDNSGAIVDCTKALELAPKSAPLFLLRGIAKANLNDFDAAIDDYNQAIALKAKFEDAYLNRRVFESMTSGAV